MRRLYTVDCGIYGIRETWADSEHKAISNLRWRIHTTESPHPKTHYWQVLEVGREWRK